MKINGKTILSTSSTTTNYVLKQSSTAGTLINSLIYDDGSNIALGTTTPLTGGGASKWITLNGSTYGGGIISSALGVAKGYLYYDNASETFALQGASGVGATIWTNSAERMRITSGGRVGIGITNPDYKFQVYDTSDGIVGHFGGGVSNYALISFRSNEANVYSTSLGSYNSGMLFRTGATDRMYMNSSGNVGIGTTTPDASALLDVSSTTQGFLPPRMTTSERDAISSPASGLMIWNTDNRQIEVFSVSVWVGL